MTTIQNPCLQQVLLQEVVASVKWAPNNPSSHVSLTSDAGRYSLFDVRARMTAPAQSIDTRKVDLFTHEYIGEHTLVLGFGDGELRHLDLRRPNVSLVTAQDPFVDAIGRIEYHAGAGAFVVSGYSDFTVWRLNSLGAMVWSHSGGSSRQSHQLSLSSAVFFDSETVLNTDANGTVGLFRPGFAVPTGPESSG